MPSKRMNNKKKRITKGKPAVHSPKSMNTQAAPSTGQASSGGSGAKRPWSLANQPGKGASKEERRQYYREWAKRLTVAEDEGEIH